MDDESESTELASLDSEETKMKDELAGYIGQALEDIEYQKEKITALEGIIKHLNARGFQIKAAIDWEKFKAGI